MTKASSNGHKPSGAMSFLAVLSPLAILLVWTLLTFHEMVPAVILPSPLAVAASFLGHDVNGYSGVSDLDAYRLQPHARRHRVRARVGARHRVGLAARAGRGDRRALLVPSEICARSRRSA